MSTIHQLNDVALSSALLASNDVLLGYDTSAGASLRIGVNKVLQVAVGLATTDSVAFYGSTPVVQPASSSQASVQSTAIAAVTSTAATSTNPFGYGTSTQADNVLTRLASTVSQVNALTVLVNQMRADLVTLGLIKGAA